MPEHEVPTTKMQAARAVLLVLITALMVGVIVADFLRIDAHSHSASDTLINWVPQTAVIVVIALICMRAVRRQGR